MLYGNVNKFNLLVISLWQPCFTLYFNVIQYLKCLQLLHESRPLPDEISVYKGLDVTDMEFQVVYPLTSYDKVIPGGISISEVYMAKCKSLKKKIAGPDKVHLRRATLLSQRQSIFDIFVNEACFLRSIIHSAIPVHYGMYVQGYRMRQGIPRPRIYNILEAVEGITIEQAGRVRQYIPWMRIFFVIADILIDLHHQEVSLGSLSLKTVLYDTYSGKVHLTGLTKAGRISLQDMERDWIDLRDLIYYILVNQESDSDLNQIQSDPHLKALINGLGILFDEEGFVVDENEKVWDAYTICYWADNYAPQFKSLLPSCFYTVPQSLDEMDSA